MVSVARMSGVGGIRKGVYLLYLVGSMTQVIHLCMGTAVWPGNTGCDVGGSMCVIVNMLAHLHTLTDVQ